MRRWCQQDHAPAAAAAINFGPLEQQAGHLDAGRTGLPDRQ